LDHARSDWLQKATDDADRQRRERTSFLQSIDDRGFYADFIALH